MYDVFNRRNSVRAFLDTLSDPGCIGERIRPVGTLRFAGACPGPVYAIWRLVDRE